MISTYIEGLKWRFVWLNCACYCHILSKMLKFLWSFFHSSYLQLTDSELISIWHISQSYIDCISVIYHWFLTNFIKTCVCSAATWWILHTFEVVCIVLLSFFKKYFYKCLDTLGTSQFIGIVEYIFSLQNVVEKNFKVKLDSQVNLPKVVHKFSTWVNKLSKLFYF